MTAGFNRTERTAFKVGRGLMRWADRHFARRMAGKPDLFVLSILAGAVAGLGLVAWWVS